MLVLGFGICGVGWLLLALAPLNALGVAAFALMLLMFGVGAVFIFINFLALRQSVTPAPHARAHDQHHALADPAAGRSRRAARWLAGEHFGLRAALGFAGISALLLAMVAWRIPVIRSVKTLPMLKAEAIAPYSSDQIGSSGRHDVNGVDWNDAN